MLRDGDTEYDSRSCAAAGLVEVGIGAEVNVRIPAHPAGADGLPEGLGEI